MWHVLDDREAITFLRGSGNPKHHEEADELEVYICKPWRYERIDEGQTRLYLFIGLLTGLLNGLVTGLLNGNVDDASANDNERSHENSASLSDTRARFVVVVRKLHLLLRHLLHGGGGGRKLHLLLTPPSRSTKTSTAARSSTTQLPAATSSACSCCAKNGEPPSPPKTTTATRRPTSRCCQRPPRSAEVAISANKRVGNMAVEASARAREQRQQRAHNHISLWLKYTSTGRPLALCSSNSE